MLIFALACATPEPLAPPPAPAAETTTAANYAPADSLSAGISLKYVPPGTWEMGLSLEDEDYDPSHTPHEVTLDQDIWVSETEITVTQWLTYMDYHPAAIWNGLDFAADELANCADCPVHSISWHEIAAYTNTLSRASGLEECFRCEGEGTEVECSVAIDPYECTGYRLMTEAEWEWAAIGDEGYAFPGSDDIDAVGYWEENSGSQPHPVATKIPNGYGLYDMGGNIREYVLDYWAMYPEGAVVNPYVYPQDGAYPTERGGSWACRRPELRVNRRNLTWDYARDVHSGFRVARLVTEADVIQ